MSVLNPIARWTRPVGVAAAAASALLALAACGSGGSSAPTAASSAPAGSASAAAPSATDVTALGGAANAAAFAKLYAQATAAGQTKVTIYTPLTETYGNVFKAFEARFPQIRVSPLQTVGAPLQTKVTAEASSGQHAGDIVASGAPDLLIPDSKSQLAAESLFALPAQLASNPKFVSADKTIFAIDADPRGILYNKSMVSDPASLTWRTLLSGAYKGKIAIADPTTPGGGLELMMQFLHDPRYGAGYIKQLAAQNVTFVANTSQCNTDVALGQYAICLTGAAGVYTVMQGKGAPVGFVYPDSAGNSATFFFAGILKSAPDPLAARLFLNWLYTPEAVAAKAALGHSPLIKTTVSSPLPSLDSVDLLWQAPLASYLPDMMGALPVIKSAFGK